MVNWIVEDGVFGSSVTPLVKEIQAQGHQVRVIDYGTGSTDYENFFPEDECILFYGSLYIATKILAKKIQRGLDWVPGVIGKMQNYHCTHYYNHLGKWLLNSPNYILPLDNLSYRVGQADNIAFEDLMGERKRLFVRPDSPLKTFPGGVYSREELADLRGFVKRHYLESQKDLVVVAAEKDIEAEWRVIIAHGRVLTASQYKRYGEPYYQQGMPDEVRKFATEVAACGWQPDPIWSLDLCLSQGNIYVLEIGFLSCAAFYRCDLSLIVQEASAIAQQQWKNR